MKNIIFLLITLFSLPVLAKEEQVQFLPVPTWKPDFSVSVESEEHEEQIGHPS